MKSEISSSIVTDMAQTVLMHCRDDDSKAVPDYNIRAIVSSLPLDDHRQIELGERLIREYYLGYLTVNVDLSAIDGPAFILSKNKPS